MRDPFLDEVLEQLAPAGNVRARAMFGGAGLYLEGVFFGLVAAGELYFRVDPESAAAFESAGGRPFQPFPDKPSMRTYWSVPEAVRRDARELRIWVRRALAAARARDAGKQRAGSAREQPARKSARGRRAAIPNLGPVARRWLDEVGVRDRAALEARGSVATYLAVCAAGHRPGLNLLYALEAALLGLRWDRLPEAVRENLRQRAGLRP